MCFYFRLKTEKEASEYHSLSWDIMKCIVSIIIIIWYLDRDVSANYPKEKEIASLPSLLIQILLCILQAPAEVPSPAFLIPLAWRSLSREVFFPGTLQKITGGFH